MDITTLDEWSARNPFLDDYVREEVEHLATDDIDFDGVMVKNTELIGRCDDYLNKNFRIGGLTCPIFFIDGELWMSATPMEIQSNHLPVQFAAGRAATLGLGLGLFTLRAMALEHVDTLTVFERDERVVEFFKQRFADRLGFDKVEFVLGDARETCQGYDFDFMYVDIYPTIGSNAVIDDIHLFLTENEVEDYCWWGRERVILSGHQLGILELWRAGRPTLDFLGMWLTAPMEGVEGAKISNMACSPYDQEYVENVLDALDDCGQDL